MLSAKTEGTLRSSFDRGFQEQVSWREKVTAKDLLIAPPIL